MRSLLLIAGAVACAVATADTVAAQTTHIDPWLGGGYTMTTPGSPFTFLNRK